MIADARADRAARPVQREARGDAGVPIAEVQPADRHHPQPLPRRGDEPRGADRRVAHDDRRGGQRTRHPAATAARAARPAGATTSPSAPGGRSGRRSARSARSTPRSTPSAATIEKSRFRSRIRQVASGRFGVDAEYLVNADELSIKMAQGAKPGEGGQLMGKKVTTEIAEIRFAKPGTDLISPPPHHDIYSIEDLAQLIYDLKAAKPGMPVSVKLVAVENIGTIAVGRGEGRGRHHRDRRHRRRHRRRDGVAKEHAGLPSEMGLAEAHQALVVNGLRKAVKLRVGGGIKNGHDVIKYALFGADEFSFGQALMVSVGCIVCKSATSRTARPGSPAAPKSSRATRSTRRRTCTPSPRKCAAAARADGLQAPLRDHRPLRPARAADRPQGEAPAGGAARRVEVHPAGHGACRGCDETFTRR